jgi:regulatory protein
VTGQITKLEIQKKNKQRVNVFVDERFAFAVTLNVALGLKKGQFLSEADITQYKTDDERHRAYERAVYFLGFRSRSRVEIERYLREKEFSAGAIDAAVQRLIDEKYLDDAAFAESWVDNRQRFRPKSRRALRYELKQKGLRDSEIEGALEAVDETDAAWRAIEPKLRQYRGLDWASFQKKAGGFLSRRGFNYDVVRSTLERAWEELAPPEADYDPDTSL